MQGTSAIFMQACLEKRLPFERPDIVLLEFDMTLDASPDTDKYMENSWRWGLESLIRGLGSLPNRPAVIYMHAWIPGFFNSSFAGLMVEDETGILGKYYQLPSISMRSCLYRSYIENVPGFREQDFTCTGSSLNYLGHRYVADMLISMLQDEAAQVLFQWATGSHSPAHAGSLPAPLLRSSFAHIMSCLVDTPLRRSIVSRVGWTWESQERENGDPLMGLKTTVPESYFTMKVDTRVAQTVSFMAPGAVTLALGYLKGSTGMGMGQVDCLLGCHCTTKRRKFDGHWDQAEGIVKWLYFGVTESRSCLIKVTNLDATSSGSHDQLIVALYILRLDWEDADMFTGWVRTGVHLGTMASLEENSA
eukprot:jgi/Botrbrau1/15762/Bobra.4_1s0126.1